MRGAVRGRDIAVIGADDVGGGGDDDAGGAQVTQIYGDGIPLVVRVLGARLAARRRGAGGASVLRVGARGRTVPRYPGVAHVRAAGAAVTGRHGLRARQGRFRRDPHPRAPEEELGEAAAKSAAHTIKIRTLKISTVGETRERVFSFFFILLTPCFPARTTPTNTLKWEQVFLTDFFFCFNKYLRNYNI